MDEYTKKLRAIAPNEIKGTISDLAFNGDEDPVYKNNPSQKVKDFAVLNFDHSTPMVAVMAVLTEKANKIAGYESLVLGSIDPEAITIKIDKLEPLYSALSSTVAAGMDYEAKIYLAAKNDALKPTVKYGGSNLPIDIDGSAKIKFKASGGTYDKDGLCKKGWVATVGVPKPGGGIEQVELKGEYFVAKPVLDIKSASVQALYEDCGNELNIQVPSLGANYKPSFSVNAPFTPGANKGTVVVVPKGRGDVTIKVSSAGTFIDQATFKVRPVPLPTIVAKSITGAVNMKVGIKSNTPYVNLAIEPDQGFAQFLPKEANYSIGELILQIGKGRAARVNQTLQGGNVRLSNYNIQNGERVVMEIKKLYRTNYKGEKLEVPLSPSVAVVQVPVND